MRSLRYAFPCLVLFSSSLLAQVTGGPSASREVGPAAKHHKFYRETGPWAIEVLEFDYKHLYLQLETVRAQQPNGLELTSRLSAREDREGARVVAAINGDFFDKQGFPLNLQIRQGEIVHGVYPRSVFVMNADKQPGIAVPELTGLVISRRGALHAIAGINRARREDEMIAYNRFNGANTNTNRYGAETALRLLGRSCVNDTITAVVLTQMRQSGNSALHDSLYILSAHGRAANWAAQHLVEGDTVKLLWQIPQAPACLTAAIGGTPRLIRDGKISIESEVEQNHPDFAPTRHPRTAIGFNERNTRMYFVVVDGRQPGYSVGMSLQELAEFLLELGCTQAINLDGGGSSTMVVRGDVVNRPSDLAGERPVANALLLISSAPQGPAAFLSLWPKRIEILTGEEFKFSASQTDSFYNPILTQAEEVQWRTTALTGRLANQGIFTAGSQPDSGYVFAATGIARDSAKVIVHHPMALEIVPAEVNLKLGTTQRFSARIITSTGKHITLAAAQMHWSIDFPGVTLAPDGTFVASRPGRYTLIAIYESPVSKLKAEATIEVD